MTLTVLCSFHYQTSMIHIKTILKTTFILLMLLVDIWHIVLPSIQKYRQKAIVVEVSTTKSDSLLAPAATFCRYGPQDS